MKPRAQIALLAMFALVIAIAVRATRASTRVILAKDVCNAMESLGAVLPPVPGGCLFDGEARGGAQTMRLTFPSGTIEVPRYAVLAEASFSAPSASASSSAPTATHPDPSN